MHSTSDTASFCPNFDSHDRAVHGISTRMFRNLWRVDGLQGSLTVFTPLSERLLKTLKSFAMRREKDDPARGYLKIAICNHNFSNVWRGCKQRTTRSMHLEQVCNSAINPGDLTSPEVGPGTLIYCEGESDCYELTTLRNLLLVPHYSSGWIVRNWNDRAFPSIFPSSQNELDGWNE